MGILDGLLGQPTDAAQQAQPAPTAKVPDTYGDLYSRLIAASNANIDAERPLTQRGLLNLITGADRKAAAAGVAVTAPEIWQKFLATQGALTDAQLATARNVASTGALAGVNIDPANPMASVPALTSAYGGVLNPGAPGAPQSGNGSGDAPNPLQQQRAFLMWQARFAQIQGNAQGAADYYKLANGGVPQDTALLPNGAVGDGITGQPINQDAGTLLAARAGQKTAAEEAPRVAGQIKVAGNQAALDRTTHAVNADTDAAHALVNGVDTRTGLPSTRTQADLLRNGTGNFANSNPYFEGQQAELKDLRGKAESADQGLDMGMQIANAANGIYTGKGAGTFQDVRKLALAAGELTGAKPSDAVLNDTSKFEQLKFASQQLAAVAAHTLSSRTSNMLYGAIASVKPGDQSSVRGLKDLIANQVLPELQRQKAIYRGTSAYYRTNPMRNDAQTVVPGQVPVTSFGVRDMNSARPGDYFIDARDGRLRQRPEQ